MEEKDFIAIWKTYDQRLEEARLLNLQSWSLNVKWFESMQTGKVKSKMNSLSRFKLVAVMGGLGYILLLSLAIYVNHLHNLFFSLSVAAILLITLFVTGVYLRHMVLIRQMNYSANLTQTQDYLSRLQTSTVRVVRIAWLQLPFYSTWFWSTPWIVHHPLNFWTIPFPITLIFFGATVWLYRNISLGNMDKKWFQILFNTPEWKSVRKSMEFINEIDDFKKELS